MTANTFPAGKQNQFPNSRENNLEAISPEKPVRQHQVPGVLKSTLGLFEFAICLISPLSLKAQNVTPCMYALRTWSILSPASQIRNLMSNKNRAAWFCFVGFCWIVRNPEKVHVISALPGSQFCVL